MVEFTKDYTYNGIKECEAILKTSDNILDCPKLVIRQESKNSKTWLVGNRYFSDGYGSQAFDVYKRGLTKREAKKLATNILVNYVVGKEPGGKLIFNKQIAG